MFPGTLTDRVSLQGGCVTTDVHEHTGFTTCHPPKISPCFLYIIPVFEYHVLQV